MSEYEITGHRGRCYCRTNPDTRAFEVLVNGQWIALGPLQEIERLRAENEKLRERLEKAHSFISRADWMQFFEEEQEGDNE